MPRPTTPRNAAAPLRPWPAPRASQDQAFAAIDLGTNNCRLLVATPAAHGFRVIDSFNRIVRLGEGLHGSGVLGADAMDRAVAALAACTARLGRHPLRGFRAIATEACRRAANAPAFLARVRAETGVALDVISPHEEASLALESCAQLLDGPEAHALVFDIGGGSTEVSLARLAPGARPELVGYDSLPIGVSTLAERHGPAMFTPAGFDAMVADAHTRLLLVEAAHGIAHKLRHGGVRAIGTSGTATTLASVSLNLVRYRRPLVDGLALSAETAGQALRHLRSLPREALVDHPCVGPERADFVLPGCAVFAAIQRLWAFPHVMVADRGLREGMLLRLMRAAAGPAPAVPEPAAAPA